MRCLDPDRRGSEGDAALGHARDGYGEEKN